MSNVSDPNNQPSASKKRAHLAALLREKASAAKSVLPLSHGQKALWFLHQSAPESAAYNTAFAVRIRSPFDMRHLRAAFQDLVARHPSLRTTFERRDGEPVQVRHGHQELHCEQHHLPSCSEAELRSRVAEEYRRPFDLERGPLLRISLFTRGDDDHVLLLTIHHIVCDAWSIWMLAHEFRLLYLAKVRGEAIALPPLLGQYSDYIEWQSQMLAGPEGERLSKYWREQLSGAEPVLNLPSDFPRPPSQSFRGASHQFQIAADLVERIVHLAKSQGTTLYTCLLAAFQVLLSRYSGQDDILVGSPVNGRTQTDFAGTIGYFANPVVVRADLSGNPGFDVFLSQVRHTVLAALAHQDYPFPLLVERLQPNRDPSRSPLVQVLCVLQQPPQTEELRTLFTPGDCEAQVHWGDLRVERYELDQMEGQFDLTLETVRADRSLRGVFKYNTDLYEPATIARMEKHFCNLLEAVSADPQQPIGQLPMLGADEKELITVQWNQTQCDLPCPLRLHSWIEAQAERTPAAVAVSAPSARVESLTQLTYRELNRRANQLARYLRSLGVGPDVPVAVSLERSCELLIALLGILKAGGAYVPLDPGYPADRLDYMLRDSRTPVLLTHSKLVERVMSNRGGQREDGSPLEVICIDSDWPNVATHEATNPPPNTEPDHLAYIIYTSGSTGRPKGAMNTHRGICNRLDWMQKTFRLTQRDRVLQKTPISFDVSVWELFWPLLTGARLVMAEPGGHQDQAYLVDVIDRESITTMHFVPSMLHLFLEAPDLARCRSLRRVVCSGEALSFELQQRFFERLQCELYNLYGPTEAAIDVTWWKCRPDDTRRVVPIGRPISNTQIYILDAHRTPTPIGVPGEIYIGGHNVARGYLNRPELTEERFVPDPFAQRGGEKLYRTGDRARFLADGNVEYLDRIDHQVKIRGCRVELGEIELALCHHPAIKEAVVVVQTVGESDARLVAYLVTCGNSDVAVGQLRAHLSEQLPEYMVPSHFITLDALPLSPNGKVDRRALPKPASDRKDSADQVAPRGEAERLVAGIWREALHVDRVGIHDNFFELGGHSLLLGRIQNRVRETFGQSLTMVEMFQHPTVYTLAKRLTDGKPVESSIARPGARGGPERTGTTGPQAVAIIGMACRFPGADDVDSFWRNLCDGVESISFFSDDELQAAGVDPQQYRRPNYVAARGILPDVGNFDAAFFGYTPREAETMDVQQRAFLECAWAAIEDAAYDPLTHQGSIGVFAGASMSSYFLNNVYPRRDVVERVGGYQLMIRNDKDYLPTRTAYKLNLKGPSVSIQTACSTSLVAVHVACQNLLDGHCDVALAGGVSIGVPQVAGYLYEDGMMLSPDGHCRAFDAEAGGTVGGSGLGIVVLKRLSDALADGDQIRAVIQGSAINNDGALKVGFTAPSVNGQAEVIAAALDRARVSPDSISFVEAHGTGTALGDPIEIGALKHVFGNRSASRPPRPIGTVKTNIGHLDAAAGVAGLIKATLALQHRQLPPSLNYQRPNREIDFDNSPFFVNTKLLPLSSVDGPLRAGVSSFGIGGTNAHVVLQEPPDPAPSGPSRPGQILVLSAKTPSALDEATANLQDHLNQRPELALADVAYTLAVGRAALDHRRVMICPPHDDATQRQSDFDSAESYTAQVSPAERPVVFMFTGQGSQYVNMAAGLRDEPVFDEALSRCTELLKADLEFDLLDIIYPGAERTASAGELLQSTAVAQPALFAVEYALARLWMSWGVRPRALIGHSVGELVAACLAGVFSLSDAVSLVAERGRMMQAMPTGAMLAVPQSEAQIRNRLNGRLSLAAVNSPINCVVSGDRKDVESFQRQLEQADIAGRLLKTSHGFHSKAMDAIVRPFARRVRQIALHPPDMPLISNVTGDWMIAEQATDPDYWASHLRETVRFADGLQTILAEPSSILLEVGPGQTLANLARQNAACGPDTVVFSSIRHPTADGCDQTILAGAAGRLWASGGRLDWAKYYAHERRRRVSLPTYPFQRSRFWIDAPDDVVGSHTDDAAVKPDVADWFYLPSWQRSAAPTSRSVAGERWLLLADGCGLASALADRLEAGGADVVLVRSGSCFSHDADGTYTIDPGNRQDYDRLIGQLRASKKIPSAVVHLWNVTPRDAAAGPAAMDADGRTASFYSLVFLAQALGDQNTTADCSIAVVSNGLHEVIGGEMLDPIKAMLLGPVAVVPQEFPNLHCVSVDLVLADFQRHRDGFAERILAEASSTESDAVIALRGRHRWVQTFVAAPQDGDSPPVRNDGVYLITGGTGGIGLELAEWLARNARGAKLVLTARSDVETLAGNPDSDSRHDASDAETTAGRGRAGEVLGHGGPNSVPIFDLAAEVHQLDELETRLKANAQTSPLGPCGDRDRATDNLCALYIYRYLQLSGLDLRQGQNYSWNDLKRRLGVLPKFDKFLSFFLRTLVEDGIFSHRDDRFTVVQDPARVESVETARRAAIERFPDLEPLVDLMQHCADNYPAALRGEAESLSVLYPGGKLDLRGADGEFEGATGLRAVYVDMLAGLVGQVVANAAGKQLRILEVGAGGGQLTQALLPTLKDAPVEYWFTDLGTSFVMAAEQKAAELGLESVRFSVLDIARDPAAQGFQRASFDVVLGLDVVHATPRIETTLCHLKSLLAPGGLLCLVETVKALRRTNMVWGLADGWWSFEDDDLRQQSPLIPITSWIDVAERVGFPTVRAWPSSAADRSETEFGLIVAQHSVTADRRESSDGPPTRAGRIPAVVEHRQPSSRETAARLRRLEELGAEVLALSADVSDDAQMRRVLDRVHARFGNIHGVIHAAGVPGGGTVQLKTREDAEQEFAAKDQGSLVLEKLLTNEPLDFFVLCSSNLSATGGIGQVAYCAASSFQDAFAQCKSIQQTGKPRVIAIDWDRWKNVGMAVAVEKLHHQLTGEELAGGMSPAEGGEVFRRILSAGHQPRIVVSVRDFPRLIRQSRGFQLQKFEQQLPQFELHARPLPDDEYVAPSSELERSIAGLWQTELGIGSVGVHDDFFALGGDSLIAIKLIAQLRSAFDVPLNVRALYECPTVAALGQHVEAIQWAGQTATQAFVDEEEGVL